MISVGFLTGALALLCLIGVIVSAAKHKPSKEKKSKSSDVKGMVFAIGFFPMLLMTLSSFRAHSAYLTQFFAYFRNPILSAEIVDTFLGLGEFPIVLDFFTAIIFGSSVALALSGGLKARVSKHIVDRASQRKVNFDMKDTESHEISASYLTFCRYLS